MDSNKSTTWHRHPLLTILVAFFLTGIVGTVFTSNITQNQRLREIQRTEIEERKNAVREFSRAVYERRTRASMLFSALKRKAQIDEIKQRKNLYDDAFVEWNINHQANLFIIRDLMEESDYSKFEGFIEFRLVNNILGPIDRCLTSAYDEHIREGEANRILEACNITVLLQRALDCSYAITDELYRLSQTTSNSIHGKLEAADVIYQRCQ